MSENAASQGQDDEWISLQEASALLGVTTSTVRRWGDAGRVPVKRTLGGHRRFQRAAVEQLQRELQPPPAVPDVAPTSHWSIDTHEVLRQDWHTRLSTQFVSERMRGLGQRLLGMLIQFINSRGNDERLLHEAREVGHVYGSESSASGLSIVDTVEAFLYFRRAFAQLARPKQQSEPPDLSEIIRVRARLDQFMDEILLGTIAGYEQKLSANQR